MALGKKSGGRNFKPGESGNPKGKPMLPAEIKQARAINELEFERLVNYVAYMNVVDLKDLTKSKEAPAILVGVAKIMEKVSKGDLWATNLILDRIIGRANNAPPRDVTPPSNEVEKIQPGKKTFQEFCKTAGYPEPFDPQIGMFDFAFNNDVARLMLGARGYGKTDYITILGVAYDIYLNGLETSNLIVTKSKIRNTAIIEEIGHALEANGVKLSKQNSSCIRVEGLLGKDHSVEAITIRTSMRGRHPKRILMDDPVTEEDVSAAQRKLVKRKYDEAYKLCKNVLVIGQPAHADDLYAELRGILKKLEVPHGTIPQLDADLKAMLAAGIDPVSIEMSYHLRVPVEGSMPFAGVKYIDQFPAGESVAFIDPSDGGDYTAITVIRGLMDGVAVYGKVWKRAWYHCTDEMTAILKSKGVRKLWFETNCTGTQPIDQLRQLWGPIGVGVERAHSDTNKHAVIMAAGSYANLIHLSRDSDTVYTNQVIKYEHGAEFDDAPDSLARCLERIGYIRGKR